MSKEFNLREITEDLVTFGELKNEIKTQMSAKNITSNEVRLLKIIDSLTDNLIKINKKILETKNK